MPSKIKIKAGNVLLSGPFMDDPYFKRSVVLLSEHTPKGTLGFIINRKMTTKACDVLPDFPSFDAPLYYGGPVENDSVHFLHTRGDLIEGSYKVMPGIYWGGNFEELKMLIDTKLIKPTDVRFYLGYSGWDPGQLSDEVEEQSWIIHKARREYIFSNDPGDELWRHILIEMGGDYQQMADFPENPQYN